MLVGMWDKTRQVIANNLDDDDVITTTTND